jgi:hypothetical protein
MNVTITLRIMDVVVMYSVSTSRIMYVVVLISIIRKHENLWVPHLIAVNPLQETTPVLILQNEFFYQ